MARRRLAAAATIIGLALLVGPASAWAGANDTMAGAEGPVTHAVTGAINTENDVDWFYFYTGGNTELDLALTGVGPEGSCWTWQLSLRDPNGRELASTWTPFNEISHIRYTVPTAGKYYLVLSGTNCEAVGNYRVDVSASPALLSEPYVPPPPTSTPSVSPACRTARQRVASLQSRLRQARNRRQRYRLRAALRRARGEVSRSC